MSGWNIPIELHFPDGMLEQAHAEDEVERAQVELGPREFDVFMQDFGRRIFASVVETLKRSSFPGEVRLVVEHSAFEWHLVDSDRAGTAFAFSRKGVGVASLADAVNDLVTCESELTPDTPGMVPSGNAAIYWSRKRRGGRRG